MTHIYNQYTMTSLAYVAMFLTLVGLSCQSFTQSEVEPELDGININNDSEKLSRRVTYKNHPLIVDETKNVSVFDVQNLSKGNNQITSSTNLEHTWYFVAEVEPPVHQGEVLSATHVQVIDDKAYVSYNKQGTKHLGGLEVFDLSNTAYPKLVSQALFDYADVNAITVDYEGSQFNRKIWLALSHERKGAAVREVNLDDGLITSNITDVGLSKYAESGVSASANGIVRSGNYLYVTSGKTYGGTFTLNVNDLSSVETEEYPNAKYVAVNGTIPFASNVVSLVTGDTAQVKIKPVGSTEESRTVDVGEILHQNVDATYRGKSTLHFSQSYPEIVFITMGIDGFKGVDIYTDQEVFTSPTSMLTKGNTNGLTSDYDYIYMANGADGMSIAKMPTSIGDSELDIVFNWDLDEAPASANYITTDGEWVFVAKGAKGLKILRKGALGDHVTMYGHNNQGVPYGMEPEDTPVCSELLPNLFRNVLPERKNVWNEHPEYFDNPVREIELEEDAEVKVTFISEGAGFRNVLGYYYYEKDNPPSSPDELNKVVIFPNASARGSGGDLIQGNTMKLLGDFEAGTVIGFYVISNGWNGNKITDGIYSQYTIPEFNVSDKQQSIIFYDNECSSIVMAFEDIALPQGDKDYNDAIFMISVDNANAIDHSKFIQK